MSDDRILGLGLYPDLTKTTAEMTLRDYFAGQAMIALMSSPSWVSGMDKAAAAAKCDFKSAVAVNAFLLADAMLETRTDPPRDGLTQTEE